MKTDKKQPAMFHKSEKTTAAFAQFFPKKWTKGFFRKTAG
jgi:hypothetical protein